MSSLAKLIKIEDLREVWKHEAKDFSKWLAEEENLKELGNAIGIDIVFGELESAIGDFSADLLAAEEGTGKKVIIENQLDDTDHNHLGKIITYAAGKDASYVIWIVKKARDEHRQAIEWLNRKTNEGVGFFLIEIELWRIGNSLPAPRFNVVEKPNDWAKAMKTVEGLSEKQKLLYDFWQAFIDYAYVKSEFKSNFGRQKAGPQNWYILSIGSSKYYVDLTASTQKKRLGVGIYISDNKELFAKLSEQKNDIASFLNMEVKWKEATKVCRIVTWSDGDITKGNEWNSFFDWYIGTAIKFKEMIKKFDV